MSKKFYIQTHPKVSKVFLVDDSPAGSIIMKGHKADSEESYKIFNMVSGNDKPKLCLLANIKQTSFKFKDLADLTHVEQGRNKITIIVNDIHDFSEICIIKLGDELAKFLRIGKYIRLIKMNKQEFSDAVKFDNRALLARGIDPVGATWIALLMFVLDERTNKKDWEYLCESKIKVYMTNEIVNREIDLANS